MSLALPYLCALTCADARPADIIALLIIGVLLTIAYVAWEAFLERKLDAHSPAWWTPPPLMRVSLWGRARGKLAVTLCLALLEYGGFNSFSFWVQLYYQDYEKLNPVLTMVRLLPMFVTGVIANVIVALVVGRVPLVILVSACLTSFFVGCMVLMRSRSDGDGTHRCVELVVRGDKPECSLLGVRIPRGDSVCVRCRLCVCCRHPVRCEGVPPARAECWRCALPDNDTGASLFAI